MIETSEEVLGMLTPRRADEPDVGVTMRRVDDQIRSYDRQAFVNNLAHKGLRVASIGAAAAIPVLAVFGARPEVMAILGAGIVASEGIQELFQLQSNGAVFVSTREALKRQKYLYLSRGGLYARARDPHRMLAEQVEALVARETSGWVSLENLDTGSAGHQEASGHNGAS
jgi:hypothetical protein